MDKEKPIHAKIQKVENDITEIKELLKSIKTCLFDIHYNTPSRSPGWFMGDYKSFKHREDALSFKV